MVTKNKARALMLSALAKYDGAIPAGLLAAVVRGVDDIVAAGHPLMQANPYQQYFNGLVGMQTSAQDVQAT